MSKKKLFLSSTDIHQMTGLCMRSARNMMAYIRDERHLGKQQVISIYDFCCCFHFPIHVVFIYINTDLFDKNPLDEDQIRREYQKYVLETGDMSYLYHKDFDIFMTPKDLKLRRDLEDLDGEELIA
ncbi:hypothetical protein [Xanthomarina gelatinilytica]|uniref:hypothetical protein n=1 Tax=Xanthomarina gelatinilytica TaxID=1137281 RepID=UPI003AA991CF